MKNSSYKHQASINKSGLLIIDAQEKILRPINTSERIINNINKLIKVFQVLEGNIFVTEQNPSKLGQTISTLVKAKEYKVFQKMDFSIGNNESLLSELFSKKIKNIIICGFETHICVQQSVIDLLRTNFKTYIIADAIGSRNKLDHKIALERMVREGATIASTESIIFELCLTSSRKEFKEISSIIKSK